MKKYQIEILDDGVVIVRRHESGLTEALEPQEKGAGFFWVELPAGAKPRPIIRLFPGDELKPPLTKMVADERFIAATLLADGLKGQVKHLQEECERATEEYDALVAVIVQLGKGLT